MTLEETHKALQPGRFPEETFPQYRLRRKRMNRTLKTYLRGRPIHIAAEIIEQRDTQGTPTGKLLKVLVNGTYRNYLRRKKKSWRNIHDSK